MGSLVVACELLLVAACTWDLVPGPGIEPRPPSLGALSLIHCLIREVPSLFFKETEGGFPGGAVVKDPSANAGDSGLSPGPGRSHMPWSN